MKFRMFLPTVVAAALTNAFACIATAAPVTPYTEEFASDAQDWIDGKSLLLATWESSGGPDSSSYVSTTMNTSTNATGTSRIVFRGNTTETPELHASDDKFYGDWTAGGINHFSFWTYHEAPVALPYFVRIATAGNSPAVALVDGTMVQPNTWTKLDYVIDPSFLGSTITAESGPGQELATYTQVFDLVERIQIGFNVPAAISTANPTAAAISYKYALDKVSVYTGSIPEPSTVCLLLGSVGLTLVRRRRSA